VYENDGNIYCAQLFENPGITNRMGRMLGRGNILSARRYCMTGWEQQEGK
jgi:hypothetical protein